MTNFINIGSTPPEEDCYPVGHRLARGETQIYARQLRREFPAGRFVVKSFPHDFGTYHEVVAMEGTEEETEAAYAAEGDCAAHWDAEACEELELLRAEDRR